MAKKMPRWLLEKWAAKKGQSVEVNGSKLPPGKIRDRVIRRAKKAVRSVAPGTKHAAVRFNPNEDQPPALKKHWDKVRPKRRRVELDGATLKPGKKRGRIIRRTRKAVQKALPGMNAKHGAVRYNPNDPVHRTVIARSNPVVKVSSAPSLLLADVRQWANRFRLRVHALKVLRDGQTVDLNTDLTGLRDGSNYEAFRRAMHELEQIARKHGFHLGSDIDGGEYRFVNSQSKIGFEMGMESRANPRGGKRKGAARKGAARKGGKRKAAKRAPARRGKKGRRNPREYIKGLHAKEQHERAERAWPLLVEGKIDQDQFDHYVAKGNLPGGKRLPSPSKARKNPRGKVTRVAPTTVGPARRRKGIEVLSGSFYFG